MFREVDLAYPFFIPHFPYNLSVVYPNIFTNSLFTKLIHTFVQSSCDLICYPAAFIDLCIYCLHRYEITLQSVARIFHLRLSLPIYNCILLLATCLHLFYLTLSSHRQLSHTSIIILFLRTNDSRTKYFGTLSMHPGTLERVTFTETWKWTLCLAKSRDLHKSMKKDSTITRTLKLYSSWTTWA